MAPADMPNMAIDTTMKAKWYQRVTLKILVSRISYIRVASATMNKPQ